MEPMLEFLRSCLKNANLDTVTKGDMKKNYLKDKGLAHFSKDDKKLFSEAIKITLKELTTESKNYNVKNELDSKGEDMVTEEVPEGNFNGDNIESNSDVDFAPDNIEKCSFITEPAFKKKSGRKILSDSEMSADEQDERDVPDEVNNGTGVSKGKADSVPSLSENDENSRNSNFRMTNKKRRQKIISDDESSLDVPVVSKSNKGKRVHSSSSSENDANSSLNESSPLKTIVPKRKKIKVSNDSQERNSRKFSSAKNTSKDKRNIINSSDSEDEIINKQSKKYKSTASTKLNISDLEEDSLASFIKKPSVVLSQSGDESISTLHKTELKKSGKELDKQDTSESEEESLTNFTKQNKPGKNISGKSGNELSKQDTEESEDEPLHNFTKQNNPGKNKSGKSDNELSKKDTDESEDEPLHNFTKENKPGKNQSRKSGNELNKQDTSESEDEPLTNFTISKEDVPSKSNSLQKNSPSESEDEEPIINVGKKSQKGIKTLKKTPNKKSVGKKGKEFSDSDDEPLGKKQNTSREKEANKSSVEGESPSQSSCSSANENEEKSPISKKNSKPSKEEKVSKSVNEKKRPSASENKIENLKKYIRAAGIRVKSYTQLFENCKSMKAKCDKLIDLLEQHGMKGRPTLEKCKKLKKKIETKKEIAELDLSNILKTDGRRSKRSVCSDATNYEKVKKAPTPVKKFSRLKDIVDSEGSD